MRTLGGTGIKVSPYCLGAMMFGAWGNRDHEDSIRIIHAALDGGINFVDTADVYSAGESEEIVGQALRGRRDDVVLATKAHSPMGEDPNMRGNSRRWIVREVESSLRRLQTDYIDLYQMHRPDPDTDIDETLSALSDLVRSGKVRAIGSSTFPAEQIVEAQWVADRRGHERFRCEQPPYSILVRGIEAGVLPTCQKYGMGVIVWSPLAGGWLTGRFRKETDVDMTRGRAQRLPLRFDPALPGNQAKLAAVEELIKIAADAGSSLIHLALAFVTGNPTVTSAIIGPRTMDQLTDLLAGATVTLDDDILDRIDQIVPPGVTLNPADAAGSHQCSPTPPAAAARCRPARPAKRRVSPQRAAWPRRGSLDQVRGRSRSQRLESLAWIVPAAAQQPPVGAVRGISRRGRGDVQQGESRRGPDDRDQAEGRVHRGPPGPLTDPYNDGTGRGVTVSQRLSASHDLEPGPQGQHREDEPGRHGQQP